MSAHDIFLKHFQSSNLKEFTKKWFCYLRQQVSIICLMKSFGAFMITK